MWKLRLREETEPAQGHTVADLKLESKSHDAQLRALISKLTKYINKSTN